MSTSREKHPVFYNGRDLVLDRRGVV